MNVSAEERDRLTGVLKFLESDMRARPEGLKEIPPELLKRAEALTSGIEVELDAAIEGDVAI